MTRVARRLAQVSLAWIAPACFAANFPETEPNSQKSTANAVTLACGDTISGTTTGTTTGVSSALGSADYFRIKTAAAPPAIYQNKLTLFTTAGFGHTASLRGLTQTAGVINAGTDATMQAGGFATSPPRLIVQWYGFGKSEEVYYRITGSSSTTAAYSAQLLCTTITPTTGPVLVAGNITITTAGQGHTTNTDLWVYDSNFNAIAGYGNDNDLAGGVTQSTLTRSFAAGTYYLAVSVSNLANNQPSNSPDEGSPSGIVLDLPDAVASNSLSFPTNCSVSFNDAAGSNPVALATVLGFDVLWVQFTVQTGGACCVGATCGLNLATGCAAANGVFLGVGTTCGAPPCPMYEVEPNDTKAAATFVDFGSISTVSGITTGSSTTTPGAGSADYWRITTLDGPGRAIWRHRLSLQSATSGHVITLRGLSQTDGVIAPGTDFQLQSSSSGTTPPNFVQWYGFGDREQVYCSVTGTSLTTAPYVLSLESTPIGSVLYAPVLVEGTLTITAAGQGHTTDTDFWVYDGNLNPIPGYGNDDVGGIGQPGALTRTFAPGQYYLAITNYNLANSLASPPDDLFDSGPVSDFADVTINSSTSAPVTLNVAFTDALGTHPLAVVKTEPYQVVWISMTVDQNGACCVANACTQQILLNCAAAGGYYYGPGSACPLGGCPLVETEPNNNKSTAMAVTLDCGDSIGGYTTGTSTTVAGLGSADYWRVKTAPQTGAFAWRHRLTLQSATPGHEISLRGLTQTAGVINAGTDATLGVSTASTNPPRFVQWYGFGRQEEVYCRVTGTAATTSPYVVVHECQSVSVLFGGYLREGTITITTNGQGHTTDTDLWVYDSAKNPIAGYGNDDTPGVSTRSTLTRTFAPGTYTLALSRWNLANALASPADDGFRSGDVTDFGDIILCESSFSPSVLDVSFTDADGVHTMPITSNEPFEVVWIRFQVSEPVACCLGSSCTLVGPDYCRYSGGYIQGGAPCGATCPPQEVEPNDSKAAAGLLVTGPCDFDAMVLIAGSSTGSSTTTPGATSADYWRVRTPAASVGLYTHTVFLFGSADGYTLELLGLTQTGGVINSSSEAVLLSAVGTSSQYAHVSWNGFGRQGDVILRVTGTPTTTLPYFLGYYCSEVPPPFSSGVFAQGPITITTVGPSQTANTDLWVYDGNWNAIAGFGNDDAAGGTGAQSTLTRTFAPGNYYIAFSERNLANSLPSPEDDLFRNGPVTDFADVVVGGVDSGGSIALDVAISDALGGADSITAQTFTGARVAWLRFSVAPAGACCVGGTCTTRLLTDCNSNSGYYFGDGAACPAAGCPFVEAEPNESKATATAVTLDCGQYVGGKSTGSSTTVPGLGSADYFRIQTTAAAPGIYRHRLLYSTSTTAVHSPTLRGLSQFNGVIGTSDSTFQFASASTTPPNFCQWYGFGRQESVYYRVAGTSSTTATYLAQLECEPVTPLVGPTLAAGNITIGRSGHTTNTDLWVYDANLLPLPGYGNDEPNTLTRSYAAGTYYLAISNSNLANDLPSSMADETARNGLVLDFADAAACASNLTNLNLAVLFTDAVGSQTVPATKTTPFEVVFIQFTVVDYGACCATDGSCSVGLAAACTAGGGTFQGSGSTCGPATCPLACLTGDANCDGAINNFDIDAFVQGVLDPLNPAAPAVYLAIGGTQACWDQRACWGDVNGDLAFNNFDIDAFVACIISPPLPGQPCP